MASSRWKRFAFFDRKNLKLPHFVSDDIFPTGSESSSPSLSSVMSSSKTPAGDGVFLVVVNGAGIPYASIPEKKKRNGNNDGSSNDEIDPRHGVLGMTATLEACNQIGSTTTSSSLNDPMTSMSKPMIVGGGGGGGASMEQSSFDHENSNIEELYKDVYKFTSTGQILAVPNDIQKKNGNVNGSLVLSFISSKNTTRVHCVDLTVRCNPIHESKKAIHASLGGSSGGAGGAMMTGGDGNTSGKNYRSNIGRSGGSEANDDIEELDGWRGYFTPFVYDISKQDSLPLSSTTTTTNTTSGTGSSSAATNAATSSSLQQQTDQLSSSLTQGEQDDKPKHIVAMAVCSDHETTKIKSGRNIYVACVTDVDHSVGVTVHRNPHLYLNDDNVSTTSIANNSNNSTVNISTVKKGKSTPKVEVYQPWGEFDYKHRGRPTCVEISYKSGIVAVGTNTGMVVLYHITTSFNEQQGGGDQPQQAGSNGTKKLTVLMEIPAPPTAGLVTTTSSSNNENANTLASTRNSNSSSSSGSNTTELKYEVSCLKLVNQLLHDPNPTPESVPTRGSNIRKNAKSRGSSNKWKTQLFVTYRRKNNARSTQNVTSSRTSAASIHSSSGNAGGGGGVCCYDLGNITSFISSTTTTTRKGSSKSTSTKSQAKAPTARYDLDGREVASSSLCDIVTTKPSLNPNSSSSGSSSNNDGRQSSEDRLVIARSDGLYTYSSTDKITVSPIDGTKLAMCSIPPPPFSTRKHHFHADVIAGSGIGGGDAEEGKGNNDDMKKADPDDLMHMQVAASEAGASYALIATTDAKSGRDAVDVYDISNKLVAFHILLSPGHKALRASALTTAARSVSDGTTRGGLSSAVVITTGGSLVTLTEKVTSDKVALLVQKNLYSAAISMAFADASYRASDITSLFRKHAEHLYRKGDFAAAMDQYIYTIGSLEPSHVIFRYLDAPKIPLLAKYLEKLRSRDMATTVHCELLKTCYLKLNDVNMAEKTSSLLSKSLSSATCTSLVSNLLHSPVEALATICSFEAPHAVEALKIHGSVLARASPRETAGIVISLCDGVYSPGALASVSERRKVTSDALKQLLDSKDRPQTCEMYPVHYFSTAFVENPKLLRVILAHCLKNKRYMTSSLKRTLLELTLEEWSTARRTNNVNIEQIRRNEAMSILSDPTASEKLGDYETLVIVQQHNFVEGEILLYERLQMIPLLIEKYAIEGTYKARRQMLALCRSDPEMLGDVLGYFVKMANDKLNQDSAQEFSDTIDSESELGELLDDVKEALLMARSQKVLPPVRVARILAGDGVRQFRNEKIEKLSKDGGVPLSVALDYIGNVLDEKGKEIEQLQNDVEEYNHLCTSMETEINELLSVSKSQAPTNGHDLTVDIDEMYTKLMESSFMTSSVGEKRSEASSEEFWRAMGLADDDRFGTLARFFAKDIIE